ncbi:MAG: hypothetical protein ACFFDW_12830 [Candidatus Thorarchaeota archaeon]
MSPKVVVTTNLTPNLLMHVFSCFEVEGSFYDSDYGLKHHFTLLDEDYEIWEEKAKKCMTLGCNAELYAILFQIPSYIPADDIEMVLDCFDKIADAVDEGSIKVLIESYPDLFDNLSIYAPTEVYDNHFKRLNEHKGIILEIISIFKEILQGLWERFYAEFWEKELQGKLLKQAENLSKMINPINIISAWQRILKIDFPYNEFIVILVQATNTIVTNLLAEQIVISSKNEEMDSYKIIVHEVGRSFLLNMNLFEHEKLKAVAQYNIDKLTQIVDAVIIYLKRKMINTLKIKPEEHDTFAWPGYEEITKVFEHVWDSMQDKNIYEAIEQTYTKLSLVA